MKKEKITLKNGLEVYINNKEILKECAIYLLINAGRWHEKIPETAHLLEHLKGIDAHLYGDKDKLNYVNANAITSNKRTAYYFECVLPKHISIAIDNLTNVLSSLDTDMLEREKEVIKHELSPCNNPLFKFSQDSLKKLFPRYTKKLSDIETCLNSLKDITENTVEDFWNRCYNPANTILCIVGDIKKKSDKLLENFEKIKGKGKKLEEITFEKETELTDRIEIKEKVRNDDVTSIRISYQAPLFPDTANLREHLSIAALRMYLSADFGSLYKKLRDELNLCYSLDVNYTQDFGCSAGFFFETKTQSNLYYKVEREWLRCLKQIAKDGVSRDVLKTLKNIREIILIHSLYNFNIKDIVTEIDYNITPMDIQRETKKITLDDIKNAAKLLEDKPYVISIALPQK